MTEFKGLSIDHERLPVILLNGADFAHSRVFTLFHEVSHLANRTSGVCLLSDNVWEEALANRFAAEALMPADQVVRALPADGDVDMRVDLTASKFRVSCLSAAIRLRTLDIITEDQLGDYQWRSETEWKKRRKKQKESSGFVPHWRLRYRDLGPNYVGRVAEAVENERITLLDASYLLHARIPAVEQMFREVNRLGQAGR